MKTGFVKYQYLLLFLDKNIYESIFSLQSQEKFMSYCKTGGPLSIFPLRTCEAYECSEYQAAVPAHVAPEEGNFAKLEWVVSKFDC